MSRTESTMLALGTVAPAFELMDVISGRGMGRDDVATKRGLLVMFVCVHLPLRQACRRGAGANWGRLCGQTGYSCDQLERCGRVSAGWARRR